MKIARIFILMIIAVFLLPIFATAYEVTFNPSTAVNGRVRGTAPIIIPNLPAFAATNGAARAAVRVYTKNQDVVPSGVTVPDDVTPEVSGLIGKTDHKRNIELRVWISDFGGGTLARDLYYLDDYWYGESGGYWQKVIDWDDPLNNSSILALRPLFRYGYSKLTPVPPGGVNLAETYVYFAIEITDAVAQEYESRIYFDVAWE
jgi:hypothetical protein